MLLTSLLIACSAHAQDGPRIFLDPGHGAAGNPGNTSALCTSEQDTMLQLALRLEERLEARGAQVELARREGELVPYDQRLADAAAFSADVFLSLHSDVRAPAPEGGGCASVEGGEGFSILWGDDAAEPAMVEQRHALAKGIGTAMLDRGFQPYRGDSYGQLYLEDPDVPGVFLDNHKPHQKLMMLRRPSMPSVLIETHHAWVEDEARLWQHPVVAVAFADAVHQGVSSLE